MRPFIKLHTLVLVTILTGCNSSFLKYDPASDSYTAPEFKSGNRISVSKQFIKLPEISDTIVSDSGPASAAASGNKIFFMPKKQGDALSFVVISLMYKPEPYSWVPPHFTKNERMSIIGSGSIASESGYYYVERQFNPLTRQESEFVKKNNYDVSGPYLVKTFEAVFGGRPTSMKKFGHYIPGRMIVRYFERSEPTDSEKPEKIDEQVLERFLVNATQAVQ